MNAKGKSKRRRKDSVEYLLTGKLICGKCKSPMIGESGHGRHGEVHHYYKCSGRKNRRSGCDMCSFRQAELEEAIIRITQHDVLTDEVIDHLITRVLRIQEEEAEDPVIKGMEKSLKDTQKKISNIMAAIEAGIFTPTTKDRLTELEAEKDRIRAEIVKAQIKKTSYDADEIRFYLESMRDGNADNMEFAKHLIEVFVRSIYVYDEYIVIFYNFTDGGGDGLRHDFAELADQAVNEQKNSEGTCSDNIPSAGPDSTLIEPIKLLIVTTSVFGILARRSALG